MTLGLGLGIHRNKRSSVGFDADYQAILDEGVSNGYSIPSSSVQGYGSTLVEELKEAGIWSKLDLFYVFGTDGDSDFATLNWVDPSSYQCTKVNSPTFTSLEGFTGDGSSSYMNTNWNPFTEGSNYTLNSASYGVYCRTQINNDGFQIGSFSTPGENKGASLTTDRNDNTQITINDDTPISVSSMDSRGFWHANRSDSSNAALYRNGSSFGIASTTSVSIPNLDFYILCRNLNGSPSLFTDTQISVAFTGSDLSSEASDFFTAIEKYMDSIGKGVVA